jgi:hypothetical protein
LLADAVDRGLRAQQPGSLLSCCADLSLPGKAYDPSKPVFPASDWRMLKPWDICSKPALSMPRLIVAAAIRHQLEIIGDDEEMRRISATHAFTMIW